MIYDRLSIEEKIKALQLDSILIKYIDGIQYFYPQGPYWGLPCGTTIEDMINKCEESIRKSKESKQ